MKRLILLAAVLALGAAGLYFYMTTDSVGGITSNTPSVSTTTEVWECDADAKICPDGSAVGRSGPKCEFTQCPDPERTSGEVTTHIDGSPTALNITVQPKEVVSDSRCPKDVQCIWAGTVEVRTVISSQVGHGEHIMALGKPQVFGDYTVTLTKVTPEKTGTDIPVSSYRFTYEIKKR